MSYRRTRGSAPDLVRKRRALTPLVPLVDAYFERGEWLKQRGWYSLSLSDRYRSLPIVRHMHELARSGNQAEDLARLAACSHQLLRQHRRNRHARRPRRLAG
jgi:hypothetical protein